MSSDGYREDNSINPQFSILYVIKISNAWDDFLNKLDTNRVIIDKCDINYTQGNFHFQLNQVLVEQYSSNETTQNSMSSFFHTSNNKAKANDDDNFQPQNLLDIGK